MQIEQILEKEREEIIKYGIKRGKIIFISTLITIMLGFFLGVAWQSIIFWFSLSILRKYAGGYHADTEKRCYAISFAMVLISLFCIKQMNIFRGWEIILQTINTFIILFLAPVENTNHILDKEEKKKYTTKTRITVTLLYAIYVFLCFINKQEMANSIGMAIFVVTISLILGYIKNDVVQ